MKKIYTLIALILMSIPSFSQNPTWNWGIPVGQSAYEEGAAITTDAAGNIFMAGSFYAPSTVFGTTTLINAGLTDMFIAKYDATGNVLWAKSAGGTQNEFPKSISTDAAGNVYVAGYYTSPTVSFGTTILTNSGADDLFLAKYAPNGNLLWVKRAGGPASDAALGVKVNSLGNIYLTGYFDSPSLSFGGYTITSNGLAMFLVKYDASGNVLWAKTPTSQGAVTGNCISTDVLGNIFVAGDFNSSGVTFGATTIASVGYNDMFIVKYDANGNAQWAKSAGGALGYVYGTSLVVDNFGNVAVTGDFGGTPISFGSNILTNTGTGDDVYIAKYDGLGNILWAKQAGGIKMDNSNTITTDAVGNFFIGGSFRSSTFTSGTTTLTCGSQPGNTDLFIVKLDYNGNSIWAEHATYSYFDVKVNALSERAGSLLVVGTKVGAQIDLGSVTIPFGTSFIAQLDGVTAIDETQNKNEWSIYPNPASNHLTITLPNNIKKATLIVTDVTGKILYKNDNGFMQNLELNTTDFANGIYFVQIQTTDYIETKKLNIQK